MPEISKYAIVERGAKLSGSMFPLYRGFGARLLRALSSFALDSHADEFARRGLASSRESDRPRAVRRRRTINNASSRTGTN